MAKTNQKRQKDYSRNPFPKVFTQADTSDKAFQPNTEYTLTYQNKSNETSEIENIVLNCPPLTTVTVEITKDGQKRTILETIYAKDVNQCILFKDRATDKALTLQTGQYLYITVQHGYLSNQMFTIIVNKDQLLWRATALK